MNFSGNRDEGRAVVRKMLGKWGKYAEKRTELQHDIDMTQEQIDQMLDVTAAPLTGTPRGNRISDKTAKQAERYAEKRAALEEHIEYLKNKLAEEERIFRTLDPAVEALPIDEYRVIRCRFVKDLTMQQTAFACGYQLRGAEDAEARALDRLKPLVFKILPAEA